MESSPAPIAGGKMTAPEGWSKAWPPILIQAKELAFTI
jgi:hypothetical protein